MLIPYTHDFADKLNTNVNVQGVNILTAVTLDEVKRVFEAESIDIVLMGTGPEDLANRLQITEDIKTWSYSADKGPSIHIQGTSVRDSVAWVTAILEFFVAQA